jgi:hypothetical protein
VVSVIVSTICPKTVENVHNSVKEKRATLYCSNVVSMRISPVMLGSFSYGPSLEKDQRTGRGGDWRDILVPLINCVIVN